MKCPLCVDADLVMTERQGVEIDYCPKCRGVWLDRGELDKILERFLSQPLQAPMNRPLSQERGDKGGHHHYSSPHHDENHHYRKRQKSWLSELFD